MTRPSGAPARRSAWLWAMAILMLATAACSKSDFKIKGEIYDGQDRSVVLEKADYHGRWVAVDSSKVSSSGAFSISAPAPGSPQIYRLVMDGRYVYLPVDSVETLTLTTSAKDFGHTYTLTGTPQAEQLAAFEADLRKADLSTPSSRAAFKREVFTRYMRDSHAGILSYYLLTKTVDGTPLYDPSDHTDVKYFGAVATAYDRYRPSDPHTAILKAISLQGLRKRNTDNDRRRVIEAEETHIIDIELPDENGNPRALSSVVGRGRPTLVVFGMMTHPDSPELNRQLAALHRGGNVDIYQVSFDTDLGAWREAARPLPWTTVLDNDGASSRHLANYNVGAFPAYFIYNSAGELSHRAQTLQEAVKYLR